MDASLANLHALLTKALGPLAPQAPIAVALSGGADSVALALIAAEHCTATKRPLYFFHVHHGLMAEADAWVAHLRQFSQDLNIPLQVRHVQVDLTAGLGIEGAARDARYLALAKLCDEHEVAALLLAHHRQDQAETVLLRLLRGTGVSGLAAMRADVQRAALIQRRRADVIEEAPRSDHAAQARGQRAMDRHAIADDLGARFDELQLGSAGHDGPPGVWVVVRSTRSKYRCARSESCAPGRHWPLAAGARAAPRRVRRAA